ncbi:MAG: ABC transporter ATP-binding protein [Clostridia bacterium]
MADMAILQLDKVSYEYRNKHQTVKAVNEFSYEFNQGLFYAITGKSGSGKTTLLSLMVGLDVPTEGVIKYEGTDLEEMNMDKYRRDCVSLIYQDFNLFPLLNILENVMYPLKLKGQKTSECKMLAMEKLKMVGLDESYYKRYPSMLSGGEQQRVAIARALVTGSSILLADEPTGNLDTENGNNIVSILKDLAHNNKFCVIVVTHDLDIASVADKTLSLRDGRLMLNILFPSS